MKKFKVLASLALFISFAMALSNYSVRADDNFSSPDERPFNPASHDAHLLIDRACSVCHGVNGISKWPFVPNLAAQDETYLESQLKAFRMRARADRYAQAEMWGMAQPLTDSEIKAIAEYFSNLKAPPGRSSELSLAAAYFGENIFKHGFPRRKVPACNTCHKLNGEGDTDIPRLAGQHADYIERELREFRNGFRSNDIMHFIAQNMTNNEIQAISLYLSSLHTPGLAEQAQAATATTSAAPAVVASAQSAPASSAEAGAPEAAPASTHKKFMFFTTSDNQNLKCQLVSGSDQKMKLNCAFLKKSANL